VAEPYNPNNQTRAFKDAPRDKKRRSFTQEGNKQLYSYFALSHVCAFYSSEKCSDKRAEFMNLTSEMGCLTKPATKIFMFLA
jgi:hypothetical protein